MKKFKIQSAVFDLHGVIYDDSPAVRENIKYINSLANRNIDIGFLTNATTSTPDEIMQRMHGLGLDTEINVAVMTATLATARYVVEGGHSCCAVLSKNQVLKNTLESLGIKVYPLEELPSSVEVSLLVLAYNESFNYDLLRDIQQRSRNGMQIIAAERDKFYSLNSELMPSSEWFIAAIETVVSEPVKTIGKPNPYSFQMLLKEMNTPAEECIYIGDSLEVDIVCANNVGAIGCLISGGVTDVTGIEDSPIKPDIIISKLAELDNYIQI